MKKLANLKSDKREGFLDNGKGQKVVFLNIGSEFNIENLKADVKAGAKQFEECVKVAEKMPSQFVVIECDSEEEGLLAVSYLAGIYNEKEHREHECDDEEPNIAEEKVVDRMYEDVYDYVDDYSEDPTEYWEKESSWYEAPNYIPVITAAELMRQSETSDREGPFSVNQQMDDKEKPYWLSCRHESICIVKPLVNGVYSAFGAFIRGRYSTSFEDQMKRFKNNRHVYIVGVRSQNSSIDIDDLPFDDDEADEGTDQDVLLLTLTYAAETVSVSCKKEMRQKYYNNLFENWIHAYDMKLVKGFPVKRVVEQILCIQQEDKSELMEKVVKYVEKSCDDELNLCEDDFSILRKFGYVKKSEVKEQDSARIMEQELVGMEHVKQQVRDIVNVMKFSKYRAEMGLSDSTYHNTHLLIGAPGTAKTTIAKLMGQMMFEEKLLPGKRFASVNGAELKGMYVGHSAPKTHSLFENNDVIFIDEAYSLADDTYGTDSFSNEAISQLVIEMEKHATDKLILFAGYGGIGVAEKNNKMKKFIDANPGIKSRITSTIYFESYTPEQMLSIVHSIAKTQKYKLSKDADADITEYFAKRIKDDNFGNGREARSLLENVVTMAASRTMENPKGKITKKQLEELTAEDVRKALHNMEMEYMMQSGRAMKKLGFM